MSHTDKHKSIKEMIAMLQAKQKAKPAYWIRRFRILGYKARDAATEAATTHNPWLFYETCPRSYCQAAPGTACKSKEGVNRSKPHYDRPVLSIKGSRHPEVEGWPSVESTSKPSTSDL